MNNFYGLLHDILKKYPELRDYIRLIRWYVKSVPFLRECLLYFERKYFGFAGDERPELEESFGNDEYSELYATALLPKVFGRVLDLGCGHGYLTKRVAQSEAVKEVVGVDKTTKFLAKHPKITYLTRDLTKNLDVPGNFDVIMCTEFIEHISGNQLKNLFREVAKFLKQDGIFIGSTPINPSRHYDVFSGSRFHVKEYRIGELRDLLSEHFDHVQVIPISRFCMIWEVRKKDLMK